MSMKIKSIILIIILFIYTLLIANIINSQRFNLENRDNYYKIIINRLESKFTDNLKQNTEVINQMIKEEQEAIKHIQMLDLSQASSKEKESFFKGDSSHKIVFSSISNTDFIVKYELEYRRKPFGITLLNITLIAFPLVAGIILILYIHTYFLLPMKKLSGLPEKIVNAYSTDLEISEKDKFTREFIWGLDLLKEELKKENRLRLKMEKEKNTLVASLSHDIKTPLASIKNYTLMLKEGIYETEDEKNKALEVILDKSENIEKLTKKLLKSSKNFHLDQSFNMQNEELYFETIYILLNEIVVQKIKLLKMTYKKQNLKNNPIICTDRNAVFQVFENIIENALKYGDLNTLEIDTYTEENYQIISIENSGESVPENELKYIFTEYYRGSNIKNQAGYGLGLNICKKIMQSTGGNIYAENTKNGFKINLVFKFASYK